MSPELDRLIELARGYHMTEEEKQEQKISFVYGNTRIENPAITWDKVKRSAEELKSK